MISTSIWDDDYFVDLSIEEKMVWMYLLTNPASDLRPFYKLPSKKVSDFRLGCDFESHLKKFEQDGKILVCDGYVYIINWEKHQSLNEKQKIGIENAFKELPEKVQKYFSGDKTNEINPIEPYPTVSNDTEPNEMIPNDTNKLSKVKLSKVKGRDAQAREEIPPTQNLENSETPKPDLAPPDNPENQDAWKSEILNHFIFGKTQAQKFPDLSPEEIDLTLDLYKTNLRPGQATDFTRAMNWLETEQKKKARDKEFARKGDKNSSNSLEDKTEKPSKWHLPPVIMSQWDNETEAEFDARCEEFEKVELQRTQRFYRDRASPRVSNPLAKMFEPQY